MSGLNQERCYYLDFAKVIATFLVIYGHLFSGDSTVRLHLYAFHIPLFFFISGVFHKYLNKINWGHYIKNILWPTAIFIVLLIITGLIFLGSDLVEQLRHYLVDIPTGKMYGILWFLFALFWCKVAMDIFLLVNYKLLIVLLWAGLLFLPVFFKKSLPFGLSNGLMALPFYVAGFYSKRVLIKRKESFKWAGLFLLSLIMTFFITRIHGRVSMFNVQFGSLINTVYGAKAASLPLPYILFLKCANVALFYLNGFIGIIMILSFSLLPFPKTKLITSLSKSLITVLGTQYIFINLIQKYIGLDNGYLLSILLTIVVFLLCYILHQLLKKAYKVFD